DAGAAKLTNAGLSDSVAERVVDAARDLPRISVDWGAFPETIAAGENEMCELTVRNLGGGARVGIRVTVNGTEMTGTETYLGDSETVPAPVFGADEDELRFVVEVTFPELPLSPVREDRTVRVE
ncbi:DEAD/DEAH box helicase, partial [Halolamina salina]